MPIYLIVGPAAAIIGVVAVFFVMRGRATQKKSMYSSRRGQIERKVQAARARTLAPRGRSPKQSTKTEIAAMPAAPPVQEAAPARQAWEAPAAPPPAYTPPAPAEAYAPAPPAYEPPPAPAFEPAAPSAPQEPIAQPEWATPAPSEQVWTPSPAPPADFSTAAPAYIAPPEPPAAPSEPAGGGASWEVVGADAPPAEHSAPAKGAKESAQPTGASWSLSSGAAPNEAEDDEEVVRKPSVAMALAQYAVLVVGLVMVLIGVLVMVANAKVT